MAEYFTPRKGSLIPAERQHVHAVGPGRLREQQGASAERFPRRPRGRHDFTPAGRQLLGQPFVDVHRLGPRERADAVDEHSAGGHERCGRQK